MKCRTGCGACCIAPSISSSLPGMPLGKPAGVRCVHLTANHRCALFGRATRPRVCADFPASEDVCGGCRDEAMDNLSLLEQQTSGRRLSGNRCRSG